MDTTVSKSALARSLGLSRQALYYVPRRPARDRHLRERILRVLARHHAYGHRRIALALRVNSFVAVVHVVYCSNRIRTFEDVGVELSVPGEAVRLVKAVAALRG